MTQSIDVRDVAQNEPAQFSFTIRGIGEQLASATEWLPHAHPVHELLWNPGGSSTIRIGHRLWTVAGTHGLWVPAGTVHEGRAPAGTLFRATFFDPDLTGSVSKGPVSVKITTLLAHLLDHVDNQILDVERRMRVEAVIMDLIEPIETELVLHMPASEPAKTIAEEILSDVASAPSMNAWAARLAVSPRTITRAFQAEAGVGYSRWVIAARAQRAIDLLSQGMNVTETADEVGFSTPSAFIAAFKRATGLTPGVFLPQKA